MWLTTAHALRIMLTACIGLYTQATRGRDETVHTTLLAYRDGPGWKVSHYGHEIGRRESGTPMAEQVSVTQEVGAPAERVWAMVSDVTRMGEWSPENEGATWLRGAKGPHPGATFRGMNRNGKKTWQTVGRIVDSETGRLFSFRITALGLKVSEWRYAFEPTATGCRITETWIDQRGHIAKALGKPVSGVEHDASYNKAGMEQTLERLKSVAESATAPS